MDAEYQADRVRLCERSAAVILNLVAHIRQPIQHGYCRFSFGNSPPKLSNFKTFKDTEKTGDSNLFLECDVSWDSDMVGC